jgi:hypothetical protein
MRLPDPMTTGKIHRGYGLRPAHAFDDLLAW